LKGLPARRESPAPTQVAAMTCAAPRISSAESTQHDTRYQSIQSASQPAILDTCYHAQTNKLHQGCWCWASSCQAPTYSVAALPQYVPIASPVLSSYLVYQQRQRISDFAVYQGTPQKGLYIPLKGSLYNPPTGPLYTPQKASIYPSKGPLQTPQEGLYIPLKRASKYPLNWHVYTP